MSKDNISIEEAIRRLKRLEECYEKHKERLAKGATKMAEHDLKLEHLGNWRDSVAEDLKEIKKEQGSSKNYLIGILVSLVVASILMALNLVVVG